MKNNIKALQLVEKGLSVKTVSKLTESQINTLHQKLLGEAITQTTTTSYNVPTDDAKKGAILPPTPPGKRMSIQQTNTGIKLTPEGEIGESKKKKSKKKNPWAICTAQLGKEFKTTERSEWSAKQTDKYERCVKDVKKSLKEGKEPLSLFLENEIMRIVEKNLPPKITKGDLVKYLSEQSPAVAPTKPGTKEPTTKPGTKPKPIKKPSSPGKNPFPGEKISPKAEKSEVAENSPSVAPTKPTTKPTTKPSPSEKPVKKPFSPGKNPFPGENPKPKAISPEQAKDEVIDAIMKLLQK